MSNRSDDHASLERALIANPDSWLALSELFPLQKTAIDSSTRDAVCGDIEDVEGRAEE